jgi:hypothetical protein
VHGIQRETKEAETLVQYWKYRRTQPYGITITITLVQYWKYRRTQP